MNKVINLFEKREEKKNENDKHDDMNNQIAINKKNEARVREERKKNNKQVIRSYRLKS